jgi:hypothetical protein
MKSVDANLGETTEPVSSGWAPIPIEQLVQEVYGSSVPDTQERILARLVDKVYETAPPPIRTRLLELQTSGETFNGLIPLLINSPSLAGSGAATVLIALLPQRGQRRRATDHH